MSAPSTEALRALAARWRAAADESSREARHAPIGTFTRGHLLGQTLAFLQAAEDLERMIAPEAVRSMLAASLSDLEATPHGSCSGKPGASRLMSDNRIGTIGAAS